ncbi:MAG TPA: ABC transporter ATP-binding protein, partial [Sphingomicrobium sp.]|nr:ABC transporter ATP-binding protein [Sphingomicrobium sp.]
MSLQLNGIRKAYGSTPVLDEVTLALEAREFIAFLGPSGSGKSTLLRIIAGLETADAGEVWLDGRRIDQLPPGARDVAMVFQHYALYPHMSVRENMAFGLKNAKVPAAEIEARIAQAAKVLEVEALLDRKPGQLSGGQRQRVAIGRAIVKLPRLFLLDAGRDLVLRNPRVPEAEGHVIADRHVRVERVMLEHHGDVALA